MHFGVPAILILTGIHAVKSTPSHKFTALHDKNQVYVKIHTLYKQRCITSACIPLSPYFQCVKESFLCKESVLFQYNCFLSNSELWKWKVFPASMFEKITSFKYSMAFRRIPRRKNVTFFYNSLFFNFYSFTKILGHNTEIANNYILYSVPLGLD